MDQPILHIEDEFRRTTHAAQVRDVFSKMPFFHMAGEDESRSVGLVLIVQDTRAGEYVQTTPAS